MSENQAKIEDAIRQATSQRVELQTNLETIFLEEYELTKKSGEEGFEPGYQAWGLAGADVAVRLARMFIGLKKNSGMYEAICDLTFQLNTNDFWQKNASVRLPLVHAALNAHRDGAVLLAERTARDEYSSSDSLISAARAAPLEIFAVIAYLIGGPKLMTAKSLTLKQRLAPYFLQ